MPELKINKEKINKDTAESLVKICPFGAISYDGELKISSACKMCRLCTKKGPAGAIEYIEGEAKPTINKDEWKGIAVYADCERGEIHNVTFELLGKAKELAAVTHSEIIAVIMGNNIANQAEKLLHYGADRVYVYDNPIFESFNILSFANAFEDFINKVKPSSILVGATNSGRSLAPRVAARFHTSLTADCTVLEMKENTDLVQIRPAFGGNIMAQIISPRTRPQFCTVRYKIFSAPEYSKSISGKLIQMAVNPKWDDGSMVVESTVQKPKQTDISEADVIVAVGRGLKSQKDIDFVKQFADKIGAVMACTRPLVENGWFDPLHQIGLSGKTVKPKLIITVGISGSVQFAAGMKSSDTIIAINSDKNAPIFDVAEYCIVGDLYKVLPALTSKIEEAKSNV